MNKKGFEFSFGWIFAIIVGSAIIALAVYGAVKLGDSERNVQNSEIAQELGSLMNPLETGMEDAKTGVISFPSETRLYVGCDSRGNFGSQGIAVATASSIGQKWQNPGVNLTARNKYVFSQPILEGKRFIVFSKNFEMPYKIASVVFMWNDEKKYCFIDSPSAIEDEIRQLFVETNLNGSIEIVNDIKTCSKNSVKVCFSSSGCDVDVYSESKKVIKNRQTVYYSGPLIYGAIFSDVLSYECQVKRLMKRNSELAGLYLAKSQYMTAKSSGCGQNIQALIGSYVNQTASAESKDLPALDLVSDEIRRVNEGISSCKLF